MEKMKKFMAFLAMTLATSAFAAPAAQWVTVDNDVLAKIRPKFKKSSEALFSAEGATVVKLTPAEIEELSHVIHHELKRCGGFMAHETEEEAMTALTSQGEMYLVKRARFCYYYNTKGSAVRYMFDQDSQPRLRDMINKLSSFKTRHYVTATGVESSK